MTNLPTHQDGQTRIAPQRSKAIQPKEQGDGHALPLGTQLFEFEIVEVLGCGGFGIVYRAIDKSLHREVALKEYMPTAFARRTQGATVSMLSEEHAETFQAGMRSFINEAKLLAQFNHDSLVKVYRFWEANGTAYMVMPFYKGITLSERLRTMPSPPDEIWLRKFLAHILDAIAVMHAKQCFHRDIAPDNILMQEGDLPVLLDFGAARHVLEGEQQSLTIILKPSYAPIEQYGNSASLTQGPWTDLYALASVIHLAIMGKVPQGSTQRMVEDKQLPLSEAAETILPGRYTQVFLSAIDRALSLKPKDRPQSVAEFQRLLALDTPLPTAMSPPDQTPAPYLPKSSKWRYSVATALLLIIVAGIVKLVPAISKPEKNLTPQADNAVIQTTPPVIERSTSAETHALNRQQEDTVAREEAIAREERIQQLKILEEKQQAIASELDKLALLKQQQELTAKNTREKPLNSERQAKTAPKARIRAEKLSAPDDAGKIRKPDTPKTVAQMEQATSTDEKIPVTKPQKNQELFVTPGF